MWIAGRVRSVTDWKMSKFIGLAPFCCETRGQVVWNKHAPPPQPSMMEEPSGTRGGQGGTIGEKAPRWRGVAP